VWAPSDWGKELLVRNGVPERKIVTVVEGIDALTTYDPHGFDRTRARRLVYGLGASSTVFVFLSVFKWEERKGWRELMRAFSSEFGCNQTRVQLFLRTSAKTPYGAKLDVQDLAMEEIKQRCPAIKVLTRQNGLDMQMMYAGADVSATPYAPLKGGS